MLTWIIFAIVGAVLVILGRSLGNPPFNQICVVLGWICLVVALIFFVIWLVAVLNAGTAGDVDVDGMASLLGLGVNSLH